MKIYVHVWTLEADSEQFFEVDHECCTRGHHLKTEKRPVKSSIFYKFCPNLLNGGIDEDRAPAKQTAELAALALIRHSDSNSN